MNYCRRLIVCADKVLRTYGELPGELHLVEFDRNCNGPTCPGLGLLLAGNRDLGTMSVFVVGLQPGGVAANDGLIHVGDELLEVSGPLARFCQWINIACRLVGL